MRWSRREFTRAGAAGALGGLTGRGLVSAEGHVGEGGDQLATLSLAEASELVRAKKVSPVELTRACLSRIDTFERKLNSFVTVTADAALAEARAAEGEIGRGGWKGALHGIPIALKDLVDTKGVRTTAASNLFKDRVPAEDAEVVTRLRAAGAVLLGKLNMHELAFGGSTVVSAFGPVRNPWALDRSVGGSSAGSAAAVAAGLCYGALGSDTGGSIRQPAAFCGIVGLKPTFGRVSTRGALPLSWSLDHLGPMTRRVRDAALMLQPLADAVDERGCASAPPPDYAKALAPGSGLRLGIPRSPFYEGLHPDVEQATSAALGVLASLGARVLDVVVDTAVDSAIVVLRAEAFAFHEPTVASSPDLYQPETLKRIRGGAEVPASAYIAAKRRLEAARTDFHRVFETVDVLVMPTTPVPPPVIDELLADMPNLRAREFVLLRNTRPWNGLGLPAISVPCGFTGDGLPIGLQIIGPAGDEARVLALAHAYEQATDWHARKPPLA
jgi:aspartyl-tRNA(Asn)/glutamyl-tRNA(Gln) amidotransferase subunit A